MSRTGTKGSLVFLDKAAKAIKPERRIAVFRILAPLVICSFVVAGCGGKDMTEPKPTPPSAPQNLRVDGALRYDSVPLAWDPPTDTMRLAGYQLFRGCSRGGFSSYLIATLGRSTTHYVDTLSTDWIYGEGYPSDHEVVAVDSLSQQSPPSNCLLITLPPSPRLVIDAPLPNDTLSLTVVFRWHMENPAVGDAYHYKVLIDKGVQPCDDHIEERFDAGTATCFTAHLSSNRYDGYSAEYAIQADDGHGHTRCVAVLGWISFDHRVPPPTDQCP